MANKRPLADYNGKLSDIQSGDTLPIAVLATGVPDGTKFIRDDGVLATPSGTGSVNAGGALKATYYPSAGSTVDDVTGVEYNNTNLLSKFTAQAATDVIMELKAASSQSANILNVSSNASTGDLLTVDASGHTTFFGRGRFRGAVSQTAAGIDRIDVGVESGTPRMVFEDSGNTIWIVDNSSGRFRWFTPGVERFDLTTASGSFANSVQIGSILGGSTSPRQLHVVEDNATNGAVTQIARLTHTTSGVPGVGIGTGMEFVAETSASNNEIGATIEAITTNVGSGTEAFDLVFRTMTGGAAATESLRIKADGKLQIQSLANDNTETNLVVWNSTDKILEYRTVASLPGGPGGGGYTVHEIDDTDSPYTISETSGEIVILVDASAGDVTVNLPTAVGNTAKYNIKLVADGNDLIIDADGTEQIDGSTTATITVENVAVTLVNNNANWFII